MVVLKSLLAGLTFACTAYAGLREPLPQTQVQTNANIDLGLGFDSLAYDAGLFAPFEDLGLLSASEYTTLGHPAFPNYNVRIKKSDFCDGTVQ